MAQSISNLRIQRHWRFEGKEERLDASGFYMAPSLEDRHPKNNGISALPLSHLGDYHCLILLGEPGMGKTTAIEEELQANSGKNCELLHIDLNGYSEESTLIRHIFENNKFKAWREGRCDFQLWLDSLDECLLRIGTVASLLIQEFQLQFEEEGVSRFWLRIACRSAMWPTSFESQLHKIFGEDETKVLHLCPLQRRDIKELAGAVSVSPQPFLDEVERHGATALAARPITLQFLLSSYKNGSMANTRDDLFRQGCLHLCEEPNRHRQETRSIGRLSPTRRLGIAARLAALFVFSSRPFLWRGQELNAPLVALTVSDVLDESDGLPSDNDISISDVDEVLDTALFKTYNVDGEILFTFAHHTYAEFLAAYHLESRKVPKAQVLNLLSHNVSIGSSATLVPQLTETAAWMALFDLKDNGDGNGNGVFQYLAQTSPATLLRSDVAFASGDKRAQLARTLLEEIQAGRLMDSWNRNDYRYLDSADLAEQLEPFIADPTKDIIARRAAIDIAERCPHAFGLADVLTDLVLNENEDINARIQAAYALSKISQATNDSALLLRLRPLAVQQSDADKDDELKGIVLSALWPERMSANEFFSLLTPPQSSLHGAYRMLIYRIPEQLPLADLSVALHWCAAQTEPLTFSNEKMFDERRLIGALIDMAYANSSKPDVIEALAQALSVRYRHHDLDEIGLSQNENENQLPPPPDEQRRVVVYHLVSLLSDEKELLRDLFFVHGNRSALILPQDLDWLISQVHKANNEAHIKIWCILIEQLCRYYGLPYEPENADKLLNAQNAIPLLAEAMANWFEPVELDSERAKTMHENYYIWKNLEKEGKERKIELEIQDQENEIQRLQAIEKYLAECESGNAESWWLFDHYAIHDQDVFGYQSHLNQSDFWKGADNGLRGKILKAAEAYLRKFKPPQEHLDQWEDGVIGRRMLAGHRALMLLFLEDRATFNALPQADIEVWAKASVWFPWQGGEAGEEDNHDLMHVLHEQVPDAITEAILARIEFANGHEDYLFDLRKLQFQWGGVLCDALIEKAGDVTLKPPLLYDLLINLLQQESLSVIASLLSNPKNISKYEPGPIQCKIETLFTQSLNPYNEERAKFIAQALLSDAPNGGWSIVWPVMQENSKWGQEVMLNFVSHQHNSNTGHFLKWMPEETMADWYSWLKYEFPRREDPHPHGCHAVSPREELWLFRDRLPTLLRDRGTPQAVQALERLVQDEANRSQSSSEHWIKYLMPDARQLALVNSWAPLQPNEINDLLRSPSKRFVSNGDELLDVLIESLQRFDRKLQDETPAAPDLWNTLPNGKSRPKDEPAFSDRLKRHLEDDIGGRAIVVNREVEIRRGEGKGKDKGKGERTDIHVKAVIPSADDAQEWANIIAIIEVKGSWHPELYTAMETQLRDRYLKDNSCRHGLYVVGWFECPQWDNEDDRRRKTPKITFSQARQKFKDQAVHLSNDEVHLREIVLDAKLR